MAAGHLPIFWGHLFLAWYVIGLFVLIGKKILGQGALLKHTFLNFPLLHKTLIGFLLVPIMPFG
jgi:hypothetical protein